MLGQGFIRKGTQRTARGGKLCLPGTFHLDLRADGRRQLVLLAFRENFANGVVPGGGVLTGARAQEEVLCRSSALLPTLDGDPMYEAHRQGPPVPDPRGGVRHVIPAKGNYKADE